MRCWSEIKEPEIIPELVRKAFKEAQAEKPGGTFISFPENIAGSEMVAPLKVQAAMPPSPPRQRSNRPPP
ncbi:hypothetical protein [Candidatus Endoriftia persephone]|jgi:acetolactate synthase-1/2/3 large subunit|uniref:Uncharacterized protein n=1 Tax=endosymbiont of Tevnia jerichonana (vent Tica) TaxID=1049564 RepID=G2FBR3_9GAMM|nr:hypothetical protein TevJSym_ab00960 [endosymbiont of Tevnia jerichonana (vent Tica)]